MPRATRVVLSPPEPWDEDALVAALRDATLPSRPLVVGDAVGDLVVQRVEPEAGATPDASTELDLVPHADRAKPRNGHHVLVLLDRSASMGEPWSDALSRLDAARYALGVFLRQCSRLAPYTTILAFSRDLRVLAGPAIAGKLKRPEARDVPASGPCRMGGAVTLALARLEPDARGAIVLLADSAGDPDEVRAAAARARRLGVPVHVLALAPEVDEVLRELADATGGVLAHAKEPPTLERIAAALAAAVGAPHVWEEPRMPRPGERTFEELVGPEPTPLERLGLKKERS